MNINHYLFIVSDRLSSDGKKVPGREVYDFLMEKKAWGLHPTTQHRTTIKEGDLIIFYLSGQGGGFVGTATLSSVSYVDKTGESDDWWFNKSEINYRVDITEIDRWEKIKPIQPILSGLSFVKKTKNWGVYLQGGIRKISVDDYKVITESENYEIESSRKKTVSKVILSFNPESAIYDPHLLQSPERVKISRIIENVQKGWQIPNFQRYFDWNKEDVRSFLESVFNDYYVGSFLLWKVSENPNLAVEPIKGVGKNQYKADEIILDGQQRMTALYYAIKTPDFSLKGSEKKKSYYFLDLRAFLEDGSREDVVIIRDKKINREESFKELLFPFYELEKLHDWVDGFEEYLENQTTDKKIVKNIIRTIEKRLRHVWDGFEIPYVILPGSMDLIHVADIFEKINSKGKPLNTFDLLIARLLKYNIKLKDLWDKACDDFQNIKRYDLETEKTRMAIFLVMSLLYHPASSCKRKDILNLYESLSIAGDDQFEAYWKTCCEALDDAISRMENMRDGFGVRSEKDLPFMPALPMLAALLTRISVIENKAEALKKIQQWYWSACITSAYSSGADSQMTLDFKEVNRWFDDDNSIPNVVIEARNQLGTMSFIDVDEQSSVVYRAILSLIAIKGAKDFATGANLEHARENQKDHIFPKSPTIGFGKHKNIDSALNMTWMSSDTNMFIKKAKKPSEYVNYFILDKFNGEELNFRECLKSHIIDDKAFDAMKNDDIDSFLAARHEKIKKEFRNRIGGASVVETKIENTPSNFIDEIEENVRVLIDNTLSAKNDDYWNSFVSQGVREGVAEKIAQYNKKHPGDSAKKRTGMEKLAFCHIMDYFSIITAKVNWADFEDRFGSRSEIEKHFINLNEYRNCIKHSRPMNNVTKKLGEASLEWIDSVLKK